MIKETIKAIKDSLAWEERYFDTETGLVLERNHTLDTVYVFNPNRLKIVKVNSTTGDTK